LLPTGITNPNEAALLEPVFVTLAADPGAPFDVYATVIVAAAPSIPLVPLLPLVPFVPAGPCAPVAPAAPLLPTGITKPNDAALLDPVFVTLAADPAGPFDV
jgi:hypothetical protein